ncbi:MAG: VOC family protein [Syntrophomonas sp.]
MEQHGLKFHHIGLAVSQYKPTHGFLCGLGYLIGDVVYDPVQNVNLCLCQHTSMPTVEIIFSSGTPGPIDNILANHGEGIYHICYETTDLEGSLKSIKERGNRIRCISPPKEAILFSCRRVSFYFVAGLGLIEILEE